MGGWNNFNFNNNNNKGGNTAIILLVVVCCCCCLLSSGGGYWAYTQGWLDTWFDTSTPEPTYIPPAEEDDGTDGDDGDDDGGDGGECLSSQQKFKWVDGTCMRCSYQKWVKGTGDEDACKRKQREYEEANE